MNNCMNLIDVWPLGMVPCSLDRGSLSSCRTRLSPVPRPWQFLFPCRRPAWPWCWSGGWGCWWCCRPGSACCPRGTFPARTWWPPSLRRRPSHWGPWRERLGEQRVVWSRYSPLPLTRPSPGVGEPRGLSRAVGTSVWQLKILSSSVPTSQQALTSLLEEVQLEQLVVETFPVDTSFSLNFLLASNRAAATSILRSSVDTLTSHYPLQ